jgi:hypothetical protein
MKNIIYTSLLIILFSCKSQQVNAQYDISNLNPFIGTWEYQNNNNLFRVTIYEDAGYLKGDYWLIEVNNGVETVICESNYYVPQWNQNLGHVIFGGSNDGNLMHAQIDDNTINCEAGITERKRLKGTLGFTIQLQNCSNCPVTAEWKISRWQGLRSDSEPENYSIPTDVIMTKME